MTIVYEWHRRQMLEIRAIRLILQLAYLADDGCPNCGDVSEME